VLPRRHRQHESHLASVRLEVPNHLGWLPALPKLGPTVRSWVCSLSLWGGHVLVEQVEWLSDYLVDRILGGSESLWMLADLEQQCAVLQFDCDRWRLIHSRKVLLEVDSWVCS
jgi:hypothetical protein